jgi:hypothetical protein
MRLAGIKEGHVVKVNHKGREFYAVVQAPRSTDVSGWLAVKPCDPKITWLSVPARDVVGHYRPTNDTLKPLKREVRAGPAAPPRPPTEGERG